MVERDGRRDDSSAVPTIAELISSYRDRMGTPSYEVMSRKVRNEILPGRLHQLHTTKPKSFAEARTMEALAELLEVPVATIVLAYASSLGIAVRDSSPELARTLPSGTDKLTVEDRDAIRAVVKALISARRDEHSVIAAWQQDESQPAITGPEPATVHDYGLAARRGNPEGKQLRRELDATQEAPDYDPGFDES